MIAKPWTPVLCPDGDGVVLTGGILNGIEGTVVYWPNLKSCKWYPDGEVFVLPDDTAEPKVKDD